MGIGPLFYGVAEPMFHFVASPLVEPGTPEAARVSTCSQYPILSRI
ncbi:MAG: BCCT family transporter [Desulfuromonadaceae bacterium]|nr:BCCT family transporter [Desulfuromonadaceae bacterium]